MYIFHIILGTSEHTVTLRFADLLYKTDAKSKH